MFAEESSLMKGDWRPEPEAMNTLHCEDCLDTRLLITGDVNAGKTTLCRQLLADLCANGLDARTAVIDLAPDIPEALARQRGVIGAGGHLIPPVGSQVLDLRARLDPPRLSSSSEAEALIKAGINAGKIDVLFEQLRQSARDIVLINDATLYLQAETAEHLIERANFRQIRTLVVNAYWGSRLGAGALSAHEKAETGHLRTWFKREGRVVSLSQVYG